MKLKKIFSIILITCMCVLSISTISFNASAGMESELVLLKKALAIINTRVDDLEPIVEEQGTLMEELQGELSLLKTSISDIETEINVLYGFLDEIDATSIKEVKEKIEKLDEDVKAFEKNVNDKIAALEVKDKELTDKDAELEAKDKELADKDAELEAKDKELSDKDAELEAKDKELSDKAVVLEAKIKELEDKIMALENKSNESETEKSVEKPTEKLEENEADSNTNTGCGASVAISTIAMVCVIGVAAFIKKKD